MPKPARLNRRLALSSLAVAGVALTGCPLSVPESLPELPESKLGQSKSGQGSGEQSVASLVEETLAFEKQSRGLSTTMHGAWQIFHGILAYGAAFEVDTPSGRMSAVDYFREGGTCNGFRPRIGNQLDGTDRYGLYIDIEPETKSGQGHRDQWLAVVAQAGLPVDATWQVGDREFVVEDWLRQAELDVPMNLESEFSWTLIPLSYYRSSDHRWTGRDGNTYSTDLLLDVELDHDLEASVCGGTHRLIGISKAVHNRTLEGKAMVGVWGKARQQLDDAIELARVNQNPDGSFSTSYLHRAGWCNDLGESLGTTGHVLEFLAMAADKETLRSQWVQRSVRRLCDVLKQCRGIDLECGVLYHALHGLVEYQRQTA